MSETDPQMPTNGQSAAIIPAHLAIRAMRDSGYQNTAYALAELIDNSVQASAAEIEVFCIEQFSVVNQRRRRRLHEIAVLDNGHGMDRATVRMALQFGNGTRLDDRVGIGRFGMGLPSASISQARRVDVWSWENGPDNAMHSFISLDDVEANRMDEVPEPQRESVPVRWRHMSSAIGGTGTLVVWSQLDHQRLTWKSARLTLDNTERIVGRIHRRFIADNSVSIRLVAQDDADEQPSLDRLANVNDPLYLTPSRTMAKPFDQEAMFDQVFSYPYPIDYEGQTHDVRLTFSVAKEKTVTLAAEAGFRVRGDTKYGQHAKHNIGVSVVRAGRELMLDRSWCIGYEPRERWWGAEVEFPPSLDELFGVTNNKQAANHFSAVAALKPEDLAEAGENHRDVVKRLKSDGDPRGWLLELADEITRNLGQLRNTIKAQAGVTKPSPDRHQIVPDPAAAAVNPPWKERSKTQPIPGEKPAPSPEDLEEIQEDLKDNKGYSEERAQELVTLIQDANLKVVFLEADFPSEYELFNVEIKGSVTEVTFNRKHPAFDDIFGTVATADYDVEELSADEAVDKIRRAVNATKITFAAWARYEREAGVKGAAQLRKVRFDWGQIAALFLRSEPDWD